MSQRKGTQHKKHEYVSSPINGLLHVLQRHGTIEDRSGKAVRKVNELMGRRSLPTTLTSAVRSAESQGWVTTDTRGRRTFSIALTDNAPKPDRYIPDFTREERLDQIVALAQHFGGTVTADDLRPYSTGRQSGFGVMREILGLHQTTFTTVLVPEAEQASRIKVERNEHGRYIAITALNASQRPWAEWEQELRRFDPDAPRLLTTPAFGFDTEEDESESSENGAGAWESFSGPDETPPAFATGPATDVREDVFVPGDVDYGQLADALLHRALEVLSAPAAPAPELDMEPSGETVPAEQFTQLVERTVGIQNQLDAALSEVNDLREKNATLDHNLATMRRALDDAESARKRVVESVERKPGGGFRVRDSISEDSRKALDALMRELPTSPTSR